jgi:hypothetical protein
MNDGLEEWVNRGRECDDEFWEMKGEVARAVEKYMLSSWEGKANVTREPEKATRRGPNVGISAGTASAEEFANKLEDAAASKSTNDNQKLGDNNASKKSNESRRPPSIHRRESEQLVEDAIVRGKPLTLFHDPFNSSPLTLYSTDPPQLPPRRPDADKISLHSMLTTNLHSLERSRDITPTPNDPYGLRGDVQRVSTSSQSFTSPRKRAAIYPAPRWPKSGRPSPPSAAPSHDHRSKSPGLELKAATNSPVLPLLVPRPAAPDKAGRRGFDGVRPKERAASLYEELRTGFGADLDPAELIWKGIDEEYCSPEGGRFTRWRRLRRKVSRQTVANE